MKNTLAPIGVVTYTRIEHLKKTINALKLNELANESNLYIFSDAPQVGDGLIVSQIREYCYTIDGFKTVNVIERKANGRVANSRGGLKWLLEKYESCIFLEDDIVTAPGFLTFMNQALETYKNDPKILSVSGYSPIKAHGITSDSFLLPRHCSWGSGYWLEKFNKMNHYIDKEEHSQFIRSNLFKQYILQAGEDIEHMLELEVSGQIDALDVKAMYLQAKQSMVSVYPKFSLVQNIGHDGSGVHCGVTNKFDHSELWGKNQNFILSKKLELDFNLCKQNTLFRKVPLKTKIIRKLQIDKLRQKLKIFFNLICQR